MTLIALAQSEDACCDHLSHHEGKGLPYCLVKKVSWTWTTNSWIIVTEGKYRSEASHSASIPGLKLLLRGICQSLDFVVSDS